MTARKFGWKKDSPDRRDWLYAWKPYRGMIPRRVNMREKCSPVEDQGDIGSCVGNATAGAVEFVDLLTPEDSRDASRLFIYWNARKMIGTEDEDSGCYIRDAIKSLASKGVCSEELWPYDTSKYAEKPPRECYEDALDHQIVSYWRLQTLDEMRACMAEGFPVVFGFYVYASCMTEEVARTGKIPFPSLFERWFRGPLGGHAVKSAGYDDDMRIGRSRGALLIKNSWGMWGDKGYGYLPYDFVRKGYADDFWTIRKIE